MAAGVLPLTGGDALVYGESVTAPGGLDRIRSVMGKHNDRYSFPFPPILPSFLSHYTSIEVYLSYSSKQCKID